MQLHRSSYTHDNANHARAFLITEVTNEPNFIIYQPDLNSLVFLKGQFSLATKVFGYSAFLTSET